MGRRTNRREWERKDPGSYQEMGCPICEHIPEIPKRGFVILENLFWDHAADYNFKITNVIIKD